MFSVFICVLVEVSVFLLKVCAFIILVIFLIFLFYFIFIPFCTSANFISVPNVHFILFLLQLAC